MLLMKLWTNVFSYHWFLRLILVSGLLIPGDGKHILESMKYSILCHSLNKVAQTSTKDLLTFIWVSVFLQINLDFLEFIQVFFQLNPNKGRACHSLATKEGFYFRKLTKVTFSTFIGKAPASWGHYIPRTQQPALYTWALREKWVPTGHVQIWEGWRYPH